MLKIEQILGLSQGGFHRISCAVWGVGQDVPVICVHGLTRNGRDFDRLAEKLSVSHTVFCPDMPGRGQSDDLADPFSYNFSQYLNDATALIARTGADRVDWVGTSMGGLLGLLLAAQPHSPIRKLVLNDVGPVLPQEALVRIGAYLNQEQPSFETEQELELYLRQIYAPFGITRDADWKHMAAHGWRKRPDGRLVMAYDPRLADAFAAASKDVNLWDSYDKITCPTLLIRGAQSDLLTADVAQEMTQRGPRPRLVTIEGAGHAPALMDNEQIKLIHDFLWDEA